MPASKPALTSSTWQSKLVGRAVVGAGVGVAVGTMVGCGHCYDPLLFTRTVSGWALAGQLSGKKQEKVAQRYK